MASHSTVKLYGMFKDRGAAHRRAAEVKGWVEPRTLKGGQERFVVMAPNKTGIQRKRFSRRSAMNPRDRIGEFYTIKQSDVGKTEIRAFRRRWDTADFLGEIQPGDVGKRVYNTGRGFLQVENNEQMRARTLKENPRRSQRFDVYIEPPNTGQASFVGSYSTHLKALKVFRQYIRSHGYRGFIKDAAGNVIESKTGAAPYTPLMASRTKPARGNPRGPRQIAGTQAWIAQHPRRDPHNPYLLVVKSGAGVSTFGLSVREAQSEQQRGVPFLSDAEFSKMVPDFGRENPLQIGYRSRKTGKLRGISLGRIHENPPGRIIYHSVKRIYAQKGPGHKCDAECRRAGHLYVHKFGPGVRCIGLANGDVLLTKRG